MTLDNQVLEILEAMAKNNLDKLAFDYVNALKAENAFQRQAYIKRYIDLKEQYKQPTRAYPVKSWEGC